MNFYSLLHNYNNNLAEGYNAVIAKYIAGKRINFTGAGGYEARCSMAAVAMNTAMPVSKYFKHVYNVSPGLHSKSLEARLNSQGQQRFIRKRKIFSGTDLPDKVSTVRIEQLWQFYIKWTIL